MESSSSTGASWPPALVIGCSDFERPKSRPLPQVESAIAALAPVLEAGSVQVAMNPTLPVAQGMIAGFLDAPNTGEPFRLLVLSTLGVVGRDGGLDLAMHDADVSLRELLETPAQTPVLVLIDSFHVGTAEITAMALVRATAAAAGPLAVLGSTSAIDRAASDGSSLLHWVAAGLATGRADLGGDGEVDVQELHQYVQGIARSFGQTPYFNVLGSPQQFAFPAPAAPAVPSQRRSTTASEVPTQAPAPQLDEGAEFVLAWADAVRQAAGRAEGGQLDLVLGALAAARWTVQRSGTPYDPAAWSVIQSLATSTRQLPVILDEALHAYPLPSDPPVEPDTVNRYAALLATAASIAEQTSRSPLIQQRHLLAVAFIGDELPDPLVTTLGVDRTELAGRLRDAIVEAFADDDADAWRRILGPTDLETVFATDQVPAGRRRPGQEPPPPLVDRLGLNVYVTMLATMIARKTTAMPVSIGLFGEWGSGKSYFMGLLRDRVDELRRGAGSASPYHGEIVQITFNAWSYADTNLWASLAADFFTQLGAPETDQNQARRDQIKASLTSKNQVREELTSIKKAAEDRTEEVRAAYAKAVADRESRSRTLNSELVQAVISDPALQHELGELSNRLGFRKADRDKTLRIAEDVRGIGDDLLATRRVLAQRSLLLPFLLLLVAVIAVGIALVVPDGAWSWLSDSGAVTGVAAFVTSVGVAIGHSRAIVGRLRSVAGRAQELQQAMINNPHHPEVARISKQLHQAEAQEAAAQAQLQELDATIAALDRQLLELEPGRRLYEFIAERAASSEYRSQLGVVSTVRRDFQQLVDLMTDWAREIKAGTHTGPRPIDRIVLYIDDLDRCEPDQVVQVLQAVHLLLAMDLFVVVVGVDPRWLLRSLQKRYRDVLGSGDPADDRLNFAESTPQNYLEKIFQVPFVLPGMTGPGFGNLMRSLAAQGPARPSGSNGSTPPSSTETAASSAAPEPSASLPGSAALPDTPAEEHSEVADVIAATDVTSTQTLAQVAATPVTKRELDLLRELSPLVRTPRAATRLFNIYGLLRSARDLTQGHQFLGGAGQPGDYQAVIQLLGVLAGAPQLLGVLLWGRPGEDDRVHVGLCGSNDPGSWIAFVDALQPVSDATTGAWSNNVAAVLAADEIQAWQDLVEQLQEVRRNVQLDDLARYRVWGPQVARFSFLLSSFAQADERPLAHSASDHPA